jgi:hypothetical protein
MPTITTVASFWTAPTLYRPFALRVSAKSSVRFRAL